MGLFNAIRKPLSDDDIIALYWERNEDAIDETDYKYRNYLFTIAFTDQPCFYLDKTMEFSYN